MAEQFTVRFGGTWTADVAQFYGEEPPEDAGFDEVLEQVREYVEEKGLHGFLGDWNLEPEIWVEGDGKSERVVA